MRTGSLSTNSPPEQTRTEIRDCLRKWTEASDLEIMPSRAPGGQSLKRAEVIFYVKGQKIDLVCDRFWDYKTNLRALFLCLDGLRLAYQRGILEMMAQGIAGLLGTGAPQPVHMRTPYEVLYLQPNAPSTVIDAAYKALSRLNHPDHGGTTQAQIELNSAYEAVKGDLA